jgi:hypothetical protein
MLQAIYWPVSNSSRTRASNITISPTTIQGAAAGCWDVEISPALNPLGMILQIRMLPSQESFAAAASHSTYTISFAVPHDAKEPAGGLAATVLLRGLQLEGKGCTRSVNGTMVTALVNVGTNHTGATTTLQCRGLT